MIAEYLRTLGRGAANLVFPPLCVSCGGRADGSEFSFLCAGCAGRIKAVGNDYCGRCGEPQGPYAGVTEDCNTCRGEEFRFTRARGVARYENGPMKDVIHAFKFGRHEVIADFLVPLVVKLALEQKFPPATPDVVVPVPLHFWRRFSRGFNQAELLAKPLARALGAPYRRALKRTRRTRPQAALARADRKENIEGAFAARPGANLGKKTVLLVDDVMTAGFTASACAAALREAGAAHVYVLTAAR